MDYLTYSPPLQKGDFLILDGGFSTQLLKYKAGIDEDPLWTARSVVTDPDLVEKVHMDFIEAGARVIITDSYQISEQGFKQYLDLDADATKGAVIQSVKLAKAAIKKCGKSPGYILVGGSVGPYGACQHDGSEYTGAYLDAVSREELVRWHLPRVQALITAGVDFIAAETLPCWREAVAVLDCISATGGFCPVWVSFAIKDENTLGAGESIQEAVRQLRKHELFSKGRIFAVGINCSYPRFISGAIDNIRSLAKTLPIVVYANSGEEWDATSRRWEGTKEDWSSHVKDWMSKGVVGIGGCCRVDAEEVAKIRLAAANTLANNL